MMLFAFLTIGYFAGVITALVIFPPKVKEIEMQEEDTASAFKTQETLDNAKTPAPNKNLGFGFKSLISEN
jgi:glycerol uptake facilitator-like aquaporin